MKKQQQVTPTFDITLKRSSQVRKAADTANCSLFDLSQPFLHPSPAYYCDPSLRLLEPIAHLYPLTEMLSSPFETIESKQVIKQDFVLWIGNLLGISSNDPSIEYILKRERESHQHISETARYHRSHASAFEQAKTSFKEELAELLPQERDQNTTPESQESTHERRKYRVRPFTVPPGIESWGSITIRILSDNEAEVRIGRHVETRDFIHWGMADYRTNPLKPNSAWILLLSFATGDGDFNWKNENAAPNARTHMKLLRAHLRELFGLYEDPFEDYRNNKCWRTKFILVDMRKQYH